MAKKSKQEEDKVKNEVLAICENPNEVVANCDQLVNAVEVTPEENIDIAKLIVVIRDQKC